jgi:hypothetical protein
MCAQWSLAAQAAANKAGELSALDNAGATGRSNMGFIGVCLVRRGRSMERPCSARIV